MNSARLDQIEEIYHAALEIAPTEREFFLKEKCGADEDLRREVVSLLEFESSSNNLLDDSPESFAAEMIFNQNDFESSLAIRKIGRYEIEKMLGAGGMGEVYLARDGRLNRRVALKFLSVAVSADKNRLRRFEREALAASALNHPNILTIYEFGEENEINFLVTEFVEGETLRDLLNRRKLTLKEILDVAEQTAFALSAAHKAGIIHRDIKPENIMLRDDGIVKILDFGLAKLIEMRNAECGVRNEEENETLVQFVQTSEKNPHSAFRAPHLTASSGVMGTVAYMSPEQIRGLKTLDGRTDVWSLGIVLFEMLAGETPFGGATTNEVIEAVLKNDLPSDGFAGTPLKLRRIVEKSLVKNRAERYRNVNDLLDDLRNLKSDLEFQSKLEHSAAPQTTGKIRPHRTVSQPVFYNIEEATAKPEKPPEFSLNANRAIENFEQKKRLLPLTILAAIIFLTSLGVFGFYRFFAGDSSLKSPRSADAPMKQTRLTNLGRVFESIVSPDGKFLAYIVKDGAKYALYLRELAANKIVTVIPTSEIACHKMTFSPDNEYLYFLRSDPKQTALNDLYQIALQGGNARKLVADVDSKVSFSPDGQEIAFRRNSTPQKESAIFIANADGTNERKLAAYQFPAAFMFSPEWSPDGKIIAVFRKGSDEAGEEKFWLEAIDVQSGEKTRIGRQNWQWVNDLKWLPDGKELLVNAHLGSGEPFPIYRIAYPTGEMQNVTHDDGDYQNLSVTADGKSLVTLKNESNVNLYAAAFDDLKNARQLTFVDGVGFYRLAWTPDGRIVYSSNAGGKRGIWMMNADGGAARQITDNNFTNDEPVVSPDGKYIVFASYRSGKYNLWRMNLDGGDPRQLTFGAVEMNPLITADGKSVIYLARDSSEEDSKLWKISIDGGEAVKLTDYECWNAAISPDGKSIACKCWDGTNAPSFLAIIPAIGGAPVRKFNLQNIESWRFAADSKGLIYVDKSAGYSNLFRQPLDAGEPRQITDFKSDQIMRFEISPDGKQIVFLRGAIHSDAVLISNFR